MANPFAEKSNRTWDEATACLASDHVNSAASRFYYAVFQSVKGFAIARKEMTEDTSEGVHGIAIRVVGKYGKTGSSYFRERFNRLFAMRLKADYMLVDVERQQLEDLLKDADSIRQYFIRLAGV